MNKTIGKVIAWIIVVGVTISVIAPVALVKHDKSVAETTTVRTELKEKCDNCEDNFENGFCPTCRESYQEPVLVTETTSDTFGQSEYKYYEIANAGQLYWFSQYINDMDLIPGNEVDDNKVQNAKLIDNITINDNLVNMETGELNDQYIEDDRVNEDLLREWKPIGCSTDTVEYTDGVSDATLTKEVGYSGDFDGNNMTIRGLYCIGDYYTESENQSREYQSKGLFGYVGSEYSAVGVPEIKNVHIRDSYVSDSNNVYVSGIVGEAYNAIIMECSFNGSLYGKNVGGIVGYGKEVQVMDCTTGGRIVADCYGGGILGEALNCEIEGCENDASIINNNGNVYFGGIVGKNSVNSSSFIKNCCNSGNIVVNNAQYSYVGGIVGISDNADMENCYNTGDMNGNKVGGIAGKTDGAIRKCYNTGTIEPDIDTNYFYAGGIVGIANGDISDCYNQGVINDVFSDLSQKYCGGIAGSSDKNVENCYNAGMIKDKNGGNAGGFAIKGSGGNAITNCYYLYGTSKPLAGEEEAKYNGISKDADSFASGEVCWLLNGGDENTSDDVWYQNIPAFNTILGEGSGIELDEYPVLDKFHGKILKSGNNYGVSMDNAVVAVMDESYLYTGNPIGVTPRVMVYIAGVFLDSTYYTVEFKKGNDEIDDISQVSEIGEYTAVVTGKNGFTGTAKGSFSIVSNDRYQTEPNISTSDYTHESFKGLNDGTIYAIIDKLEYNTDGGIDYAPLSQCGDALGVYKIKVAPGTYYIRKKATDSKDPSNPVVITINEGSELSLSNLGPNEIVNQNGATISFTTNATQDFTVSLYRNSIFKKDLVLGTDYTFDDDANKIVVGISAFNGYDYGGYKLRVTQKSPVCDDVVTKEASFSIVEIQKQSQGAPMAGTDYSTTSETVYGFKDGAINLINHNKPMEYSLVENADDDDYYDISNGTVSLGSGIYYLRFKATDTHYASEVVPVEIAADKTLTLSKDNDYIKDGTESEDAGVTFTPTQDVVGGDLKIAGIEPVIKIRHQGEIDWSSLTINNHYKISGKTFYLTKKYLDGLSNDRDSRGYAVSINYTKDGNTATALTSFTVSKKEQSEPIMSNFVVKNEDLDGLANGKITLADTSNLQYKYQTEEDNQYRDASSVIENCVTGEYHFRYKSSDIYKASNPLAVTVGLTNTELTLEKENDTDYLRGTETGFKFRTNYFNIDEGVKLLIDTTELTSTRDYSVEGNVITIKSSVLDVLVGEDHILKITYNKGNATEATCTFKVKKQTKAKPVVAVQSNESIAGFKDGKISGLDTTMKYKVKGSNGNWGTWTSISNTDMFFAAGEYKFYYPETDTHSASEEETVTVAAGIELRFVHTTSLYTKKTSITDGEYGARFQPIVWNASLHPVVVFNNTTLELDTNYFIDGDNRICLKASYLNDLEFDTDSRNYTITLTYSSPANTTRKVSCSTTLTVEKANSTKSAPNVTSTDETYDGFKDGTIAGLTTEMELRNGNQNSYNEVSTAGTKNNVAPGTYYVRYASDRIYKASAAKEVVVVRGTTITLNKKYEDVDYLNNQQTDYVFVTNYNANGTDTAIGTIAKFYVDNEEVAATNYDINNNEISFKHTYLDTLSHGKHTVKVVFNKGNNPSAECEFNVVKVVQSKPTITNEDVKDESFDGFKDGKINGLTTGMEYRKLEKDSTDEAQKEWSDWIKVENADMTFDDGIYQIRNAETPTERASEEVTVTVKQGNKIEIKASKTTFKKGDTEGIVITVNVDYDESTFNGVKVNNTLIPKSSYTVVKGSTVVTLPVEYLSTLSNGTYKVAVCYKPDVEVETTFVVEGNTTGGSTGGNSDGNNTNGGNTNGNNTTGGNGQTGGNYDDLGTNDGITGDNGSSGNNSSNTNKSDEASGKVTNSAKTGDNANMLCWIVTMFVSALGIGGVTILFIKKRGIK